MAETKQNQETAEEPAQSPVERVTEKVKDPKKVAAGRASAAARKAKQERLLEQLRGAKESFRPPAGDGTPANIPPKEADQEQAVSRPECREGLTNWTPWIGNSLWADWMWKNPFHPGSARRPLSGVLSTHRGPVPHNRAQQDLQAVPLALDGP